MSLKYQIITLLPLSIIVVGLLGYNFMSAQWQSPTAVAPNNNTEAPINISANYQAKLGDLGAVRMRAGQYCNADGTVCVTGDELTSGGGGGNGLGYNQEWQIINRTQGVWYQNTTSQPIMVFHKNINSGTVIDVGVSTSTFVTMNYQDYDSDLDNGSTLVIPAGHYYRMNTATENSADGHRVYRELREPSNIVYTHAWNSGTWGTCAANFMNNCSTTGTQTRSVTCRRSDGVTMSDSYCRGAKPIASQSCTRQPTGSDC